MLLFADRSGVTQLPAMPQTLGEQCYCCSCSSVSVGGSFQAAGADESVSSGEVTHYQCREAFSRKLKESRT